MSRTVDERVVSMQFDNKQFESNVRTSMSTLEKLKQSLKLTEASKGLEGIGKAAKSVDMSPMATGVETVRMKFSALEVMAVTALANITNSAVNAGKRMISAITIQPIKDGFAEYETQMNAVQTILANTQKEGTNVKQVNTALDQLNAYADKTIYNFTEMTRNIGTFTAAGVKLDDSVSAIQGIANLAAVSGSTSQQASTAMYQLSQALASGTVKLMDWNSVVNAGMGGQVFQDALIRTSEHLQTGAKAAIEAKGSFRESLQTGWLTTEVLTQTLDQFATAADTQEEYEAAVQKFVEQGYTQEEAKQMADMAKTAGEAATKVKTFSQLIDTLKEALGSGWTTTWRTIIGDFEEAKSLWTSVSDVLSDYINKSADARNQMIQGWADLGGRTAVIEAVKNTFNGLLSILKPIKEAFRDVFPPMTAEKLYKITDGIRKLTEGFKLSKSASEKLKSTFKGLFSVASILGKVLLSVGIAFGKLITSDGMKALVNLLLSATAAIGNFISALNDSFDAGGLTGVLSTISGGISSFVKSICDGLGKFGSALPSIGNGIIKVVSNIWNAIKTAFGWISDNFSIGDIFAGLVGGGLVVTIKKVMNFIDLIKEKFEGFFGGSEVSGIKDKITDVLDSVHDSLQNFTTGIKATTLLTIAAAIGILSASLKNIAGLKAADVGKSLTAIAAMFVMLNLMFKSINKTLTEYNPKGLIKAGASILIIALAIKTLASAMVKLSGLSWGEIAKGLLSIAVGLTTLCLGLKAINKVKVSVSTSVAMLALAESCKILADALKKFGGMKWSEIAKGLVGMGGALAEFVIALKALDKIGGMKSILSSAGLLIAVQSLGKMADGLKKFGSMSWSAIKRGLVGMGGALAEVSVTIGALGKIAGFKSIFGSGAIFIVVQGLGDLADAFKQFGMMSWDEIGRGLAGMGGALGEVAVITGSLGKLAGFSGLLGSGAILMLIQGLSDLAMSFLQFGMMSWEEIGRGLTGMGGALTELGVVSGTLGKLAGFSGIIGSGTILILIQGLGDLANAFQQFGLMSWDEIKQGLVGMGGALTELGVVSGLLGGLAGLSGVLGAGTLLIAVQGLGDLANAFQQFGSMSWDEIKQGLVGMGGALTELAVVSGLLGGLGGLAAIVGSGSLLLAVQGLGDLANALKKFGEMSWEEIGRGLTAMGAALSEIAVGSLANTLSGLGALSIDKIAEPLGTLADSVRRWTGVTIPEGLGEQLKTLASGIRSFTFDGLGASALSTAAEPLGTLASSVRKWTGVIVPEGIGDQLKTLASGVRSFTFDGLGASALSTAAPGIGDLAGAIRKWTGVTIPEGLEGGLKSIANGVKAFTLAFMGGMSLDTVTGPIGELAGSIKKWNGVTIPEGLEGGLKSIANGVKAFGLAFVGGWTLDAVTGPVGDLAGSIKKWNGVQVPEGLESGLKSIANGIKSFSLAFVGGWTLDAVTGPVGDLASSVKKWNGVTVPSNIGTQLSNLATGVKAFSGIEDISSTVSSIGKIASSMTTLTGVGFGTVAQGLSSVATALSNFATSTGSLSGVGESIVTNVINPIKNAGTQVSSAVSTMITNATTSLSGCGTKFSTAGQQAVTGFVTAFSSAGPRVSAAMNSMMLSMSSTVTSNSARISLAFNTMMNSVVTSITSRRGLFMSAGTQLMAGLSAGMSAGSSSIVPAVNSTMTQATAIIIGRRGLFQAAGMQLMVGLRAGVTSGAAGMVSAVTMVVTKTYTMILARRAQFQVAGRQLIQMLANGLRSGASAVNSAISSAMSQCSSAIRSHYGSFKSAGGYLGDGLIAGINSKKQAVYNAGYALGQKAVQGEKDGQQSKSPSKLTKKAGRWLGEGLVIGMEQMGSAVYKTGKSMGANAVDSITGALSSINEVSTMDMGFEPTIRPVVDMNEIQNGSKSLSIGADLSANLLSKPVNSLQQIVSSAQADINASNNEVIKAINDLRADLATLYSGDDTEVALYMDSKKVASILAKPMNRQLLTLQKRGAY